MKIYRKSEKIFLILSIIIIILVFICFYLRLNLFANFLLGLLASTSIVTLQSKINYKIEMSKNMIPYIKKINEIILHLSYKKDSLVNYYIFGYNEEVRDLNNNINDLLYNVNVLKDMTSLKKQVKKDIDLLYDKVMEVVDKTCLIFKYYEEVNTIERRYLYIELVKTLADFDFELMRDYSFNLACRIDFEEYISKSSFECTEKILKNKIYKNPKSLFMNTIIAKNKLEYDTFKDKFELDEKYNILVDKVDMVGIKRTKANKKKNNK